LSERTGMIFNIMRFCVHDGPGIRTTVFFKGCTMDCRWCHNPEGLSDRPDLSYRPDMCIQCGECFGVCPNGAVEFSDGRYHHVWSRCQRCGVCAEVCVTGARELIGRHVSVDEVMDEVEKDAVFYSESGGGVTFSGGEPLMQPGFLLSLLDACLERGIHTAVETSGCASWNDLEMISKKVGLFLFDLKVMDDDMHAARTGVSNRLIIYNLEKLASVRDDIVIRIPIIPGVNDGDREVEGFGRFISTLEGVAGCPMQPPPPGLGSVASRMSWPGTV